MRQTSAKTEYRDLSKDDLDWVLEQLNIVKSLGTQPVNPDTIVYNLWRAIKALDSNLPRKGNGTRNSCLSIAEGIIDNFNHGQWSLSAPQCDLIEKSFSKIHDLIDEFDNVEFEEVTALPSKKTFTPIVEEDITTFSQLFEIEVIIKRKG